MVAGGMVKCGCSIGENGELKSLRRDKFGGCSTRSTNQSHLWGMWVTTYGWIKKKCRCVECDKARLKFYKERNAKRKAENKSKLTESNRQPRSAYKGPCPHGSFRSYKRGCRCGECRAANTLWSKVKKEKGESLPTTEKIV